MSVVITTPLPASIERFLADRRRTGADRYDEVWEGDLHVGPAPTGAHANLLMQVSVQLAPLALAAGLMPTTGGVNIGDAEDYRIPDAAILPSDADAVFYATANLVVEVLSPGDETFAKLAFYAEHGVAEVLIVDPQQQTVHWLGRSGHEYVELPRSAVIALGPDQLAAALVWPTTAS